MKKLFILIIAAITISCDNHQEDMPSDIFEVTTAGIGYDCHLMLIEFKESDSARITQLIQPISLVNGLVFHAFNLDRNEFSTTGQNLRVRVRKPLDAELTPCTTMGPGYHWVTVLDAKKL